MAVKWSSNDTRPKAVVKVLLTIYIHVHLVSPIEYYMSPKPTLCSMALSMYLTNTSLVSYFGKKRMQKQVEAEGRQLTLVPFN